MIEKLIESAGTLHDTVVADRRALHQMPELALELPQTTAYVRKRLEEMGYEVKDCGPSGLVAICGQGEKTFLLRADMDALPSAEVNDLGFKATNGNGHLCGHDMHTAQLLGAAQLLKDIEPELKGKVKLMFQPGEETRNGAQSMIDHGLLEDPKVDAAFAFHVMSTQERGTVEYTKGTMSAAMDAFYIDITGKGAHGSMPEKGIDPLLIAANIYILIDGIVPRETSMFSNTVCTMGILGGGTACNIIPETARIEGSIRSFNKVDRDRIVNRIESICAGVCAAIGGSFTIEWIVTPSVYNDEATVDVIVPVLKQVFGDDKVLDTKPLSGSEDFSYVTDLVPGMFAMVGTDSVDALSVHNPGVVFNEDNLSKASAALAGAAYAWLEQNA